MRHRHKFNELALPDSEGNWAISYGDMLTLITAFFVIFFNADRFIKKQSPATSVIAETRAFSEGSRAVPSEWLEPQLAEKLQARVVADQGRLFVEFFGESFFPSAKTQLHRGAQKRLDEFFSIYAPYMGQFRLVVTAFSDPRPLKEAARKKYRDNLQLSALRALEVVRYLEKKGVPLTHMRIQGYGELVISSEQYSRFGLLESFSRMPAHEQKKMLNDFSRTALIVLEPKRGGSL